MIPRLKEEGKKWIRHYGCSGCHEISGMEDEGRIGTDLTFEGSKPIERLDFALFTETAQRGGSTPSRSRIRKIWRGYPRVRQRGPWYDHKGFFEHKLAEPNIYDQGKIKVRDRSPAHAQSAPDVRADSRPHHVPVGKRRKFPARTVSISPRRCAP